MSQSHSSAYTPRARVIGVSALALALLVTACNSDQATAPAAFRTQALASGTGGGGGGGVKSGAPPVVSGPLAGTWSGEEAWGPGAPFTAGWVVTVSQDAANPAALLGAAVAAIEPANSDMSGVVLSPTHIAMNFIAHGGKFGNRTSTADLTLSADGLTLSGPISPSPVITAPATLTIHKQ
jgi:hypothetical protein